MKSKHQSVKKYFSNLQNSNSKAKAAFVGHSHVTKLTRVKTLTRVYVYFAKFERSELIQTKNSIKMADVKSDQFDSDVNKTPFSKVSSVSEVVGSSLDHEIVLSKIRQFLRKFSKFKDVNKLVDDQEEFIRAKQSWENFCRVEIDSQRELSSDDR